MVDDVGGAHSAPVRMCLGGYSKGRICFTKAGPRALWLMLIVLAIVPPPSSGTAMAPAAVITDDDMAAARKNLDYMMRTAIVNISTSPVTLPLAQLRAGSGAHFELHALFTEDPTDDGHGKTDDNPNSKMDEDPWHYVRRTFLKHKHYGGTYEYDVRKFVRKLRRRRLKGHVVAKCRQAELKASEARMHQAGW